MHKYKELKVWQKAVNLATEVYKLTALFPKEEKYGLTQQLQRAVVSIASNVAEGAGRNSNAEFKMFLGYANGSSYELETQITIANNLNYINKTESENLLLQLEEIQKMLSALTKTLSPEKI